MCKASLVVIGVLALAATSCGSADSGGAGGGGSSVLVSTDRLVSDPQGSLQSLLGMMDAAFCSRDPIQLTKAFVPTAASAPKLLTAASSGECTTSTITAMDDDAKQEVEKKRLKDQKLAVIRVAVRVESEGVANVKYWSLHVVPTKTDGWLLDARYDSDGSGVGPLANYCAPPTGSGLPNAAGCA